MKYVLALMMLLAGCTCSKPQQSYEGEKAAAAMILLEYSDMLCKDVGHMNDQPHSEMFVCLDKEGNKYAVYIRKDSA